MAVVSPNQLISELPADRGTLETTLPFDVSKVREDFPILKQEIHGKPLVYLDNAATTQKPQVVIDAVSFPSSAVRRVCQAKVAHLTRIGGNPNHRIKRH